MDRLSIASASAGFLGLTVRIADSLIKLHTLQQTIQHAPDLVSRLIFALQTLKELLDIASKTLHGNVQDLDERSPAVSDIRSLCKCLSQVRLTQSDLESKLVRLETRFRKGRGGKVSMIWRKTEIEEAVAEVERCKSSLLIALALRTAEDVQQMQCDLSLYGREVRQSQQRIAEEVALLRHDVVELSKSISIRPDQAHHETLFEPSPSYSRKQLPCSIPHSHHAAVMLTPLPPREAGSEGVTISSGEQRSSPATYPYKVFDFGTPFWRGRCQYRISIVCDGTLWSYRPRLYRDTYELTPLMYASQTGDIDKVKRLLKAGTAYPHDRYEPTGQTAADMALLGGRYSIYRLLTSQGICHQLSRTAWHACVLYHMRAIRSFKQPLHVIQRKLSDFLIYSRFIFVEADIEMTEIEEEELLDASTYPLAIPQRSEKRCLPPHEATQISEIYTDWSQKDAIKAVLLLHARGIWSVDQFEESKSLLFRYGPRYAHHALLQTTDFTSCRSVLHLCAAMFAYGSVQGLDIEFWTDLFGDTIKAGVDVHLDAQDTSQKWSTPFASFVKTFVSASRARESQLNGRVDSNTFASALRLWTGLLYDNDVDLSLYMQSEQASFDEWMQAETESGVLEGNLRLNFDEYSVAKTVRITSKRL